MKKFLSLVLAGALAVGGTAALADAVTLAPQHSFAVDTLMTADTTVQAHFDPQTAFDEQKQMTFTVVEDDLFPTEAVKALQPGDKVAVYGEEVEVKSLTETEDGYAVNAEGEDPGYEFRYLDDTHETMYCSDTDIPGKTELDTCTLAMADAGQVTVWVERKDEPGIMEQEPVTETLAATDVQAFFLARADEDQSDYLNCQGSHVTIRVQDGRVTEIRVDWGSDD